MVVGGGQSKAGLYGRGTPAENRARRHVISSHLFKSSSRANRLRLSHGIVNLHAWRGGEEIVAIRQFWHHHSISSLRVTQPCSPSPCVCRHDVLVKRRGWPRITARPSPCPLSPTAGVVSMVLALLLSSERRRVPSVRPSQRVPGDQSEIWPIKATRDLITHAARSDSLAASRSQGRQSVGLLGRETNTSDM